MGIEVKWDEQLSKVLRWDHEEPWDMTDFANATRQTHQLLEDSGQTIHIIFNDPGTTFPRTIWSKANQLMQPLPDDTHFVMVTQSKLISVAANTFTTLFKDVGKRFHVVDSLEEARDWLGEAIKQ